jgi:hypothetical protein
VVDSSALWGISIAAIVIAIIGVVIGVMSMDGVEGLAESEEDDYVPQTREIYLFTEV